MKSSQRLSRISLLLTSLRTMDHTGKKGDTIYIPKGTRGAPSAKAASTQVTLIAATETKNTYTINQHWEYSRLIEDIVSVQAFDSLRQFYTDDAGYALAKKIDSYVHGLFASLQSGTAYSAALVGDGRRLGIRVRPTRTRVTRPALRTTVFAA
jgi:hypothetical protein